MPADAFAFQAVLESYPDAVIEFERVIPTNHGPLPYLWVDGGHRTGVVDALEADRSVETAERLATFDDGALYRVEWRHREGSLLEYLSNARDGVALLEATATEEEWLLKVRFPSRAAFSEFRSFYQDRQFGLRVVRLYDLEGPKTDEYDLSAKQREGLVRALEMGYFEIPREATLEEVADSLGITSKSLSERLRRGQSNLLTSSLTTGRPGGVGVDEP